MIAVDPLLSAVETSVAYRATLFFFAFYPIASSIVWTTTSLTFYVRREYRKPADSSALERYPPRLTSQDPYPYSNLHARGCWVHPSNAPHLASTSTNF